MIDIELRIAVTQVATQVLRYDRGTEEVIETTKTLQFRKTVMNCEVVASGREQKTEWTDIPEVIIEPQNGNSKK